MHASAPIDGVISTAELERRHARLPDYARESRALVELMQQLKTSNADILQKVAAVALRLCDADAAGISIAEEEGGGEVVRRHAEAGRSVTDGPPVVETLLERFDLAGSAVGRLWVVAHDRRRRFDREDLRLLKTLSDFAAVAYQMIRQQAEMEETLSRELAGTRLLQSLSAGLILEDDTGAFYQQILETAMAIMRSQFASLQMIDRNGDLQLLAWNGFHPESARFWQTVRMGSSTSCGEALQAWTRIIVPDVEAREEWAGTPDLEEFRRSGIRSVQSTPLIARNGKLIGVVSTQWRAPHTPSASELRIFDVLARETADLIERGHAEQALREADRRKDEFLAVLGHELRNPLAPLRTGLDLLQRAGDKPELAENVHSMMKRQLSHLTRLVDDLLDLSRITRGQIELQRVPIDLRVVIEAAVELSRPLLDQRSQNLILDYDPRLLPLEGDFERLTQVVANLLTNAAKYMDAGGTIRLRCLVDAEQAVVTVQDSGFGIPPEQLEEVFEMFSQVPEHRVRSGGGGLGIGLALSRRLIELHGGTLTAASEGLGHGSEFVIRLPLTTVADRVDTASPEPAGPSPGRRVLVVDDNVDAAMTLHAALALSGHTVEAAHDGYAALLLLRTFTPDVILLDIGLPRMNGYELARRVRATPGGEKLLLVAITGWGQDRDRVLARDAGFDEHMTKPVTLAALEAVLARTK